MRALRCILLAVCVLVLAPAAADAASTLFVQEMSGGTLAKAGSGRYVLTVRPRGDVTAFTDRPARRSWRLATSTLLARWKAYGFAKVPPNAVLTVDGAPEREDALAVTLLSARALRGGRVVYTVAPLRGDAGALAGYVKRADRLRERRFGSASLFIDDGGDEHVLYLQGWSSLAASNMFQFAGPAQIGSPTVTTAVGCVRSRVSPRWVSPTLLGVFAQCGSRTPEPDVPNMVLAFPVRMTNAGAISVTQVLPPGDGAQAFAGWCVATLDVLPPPRSWPPGSFNVWGMYDVEPLAPDIPGAVVGQCNDGLTLSVPAG